jgi:oligogalacturonide lyase
MSKSTIRRFEFAVRHDADTGARITRLTPTDVTCHRNYFYQKCFTNDGTRLLFGGEFGPQPSPNWNYHLLDLRDGTAVQLTDQADENTFGGALSPDDKYLYFVRAKRNLVRLNLASLAEEIVYVTPDDWVAYGTWVTNSACTKMAGIEMAASDWFPMNDWTKFREMFFAQPRCRLISIDLKTGAREVILEEQRWLGHPQYRPFDDNTVAFCHEGPKDLVKARMWFVDEDGSNVRCGKLHDEGESCTHEFWVPDGSAMIYVSYLQGEAYRTICSLDPVTLENRRLIHMPQCVHLMSNRDGSLVVGDGAGTAVDAKNRGEGNDPYLYVFDLKAGTSKYIARHDTSWRVYKDDRQVTHPHPSFTPDERQVLYTSDIDGEPALYLADLPA